MPAKKSIDELIEAIDRIKELTDTARNHAEVIVRLVDRLDAIEKRLKALENKRP